jgi:cell division protein FtsL
MREQDIMAYISQLEKKVSEQEKRIKKIEGMIKDFSEFLKLTTEAQRNQLEAVNAFIEGLETPERIIQLFRRWRMDDAKN